MSSKKLSLAFAFTAVLVAANHAVADQPKTWGERLGCPAGQRVVIFHADDIGMCYEANMAAQRALSTGAYRSAACMVLIFTRCTSDRRIAVPSGSTRTPAT